MLENFFKLNGAPVQFSTQRQLLDHFRTSNELRNVIYTPNELAPEGGETRFRERRFANVSCELFCQPDYLETIRQRVLDINFEPNPQPLKMLVRTLRFVFGRRARLAPPLARYLFQHLALASTEEIVAMDQSRHQRRVLEAAAVKRIADLLRAHMETNPKNIFQLEAEQIAIPLWAQRDASANWQR